MKNPEKFYTKKVKIRLTKLQQKEVESRFEDSTFYYNLYLDICYKKYDEYYNYIDNNHINKNDYPFYKYCDKINIEEAVEKEIRLKYDWFINKEFAIHQDIKKKLRKRIRDGFKLYREDVLPAPPSFKDTRKGKFVHSIWMPASKKRIEIRDDYPNHVKIPYLGWIYVYNYKYLDDIKNKDIHSGIICKEIDNSYSLCLLINKRKELNVGKLHKGGIGIDLGVRKLATIEGTDSFTIDNPYDVIPQLKILKNREKKYHSIIHKKMNKIKDLNPDLTKEEFYSIIRSSKKMQSLFSKRRKLLYRIEQLLENYMKKYAKYIIMRARPSYIVLEDFRVHDMRETSGHKLMERILNCRFGKFIKILKNICFNAGIEVRVAPRKYPSSKICHRCGNVRWSFSSQKNYICTNPECEMYGKRIDRDVNAALVLCYLDQYRVVTST